MSVMPACVCPEWKPALACEPAPCQVACCSAALLPWLLPLLWCALLLLVVVPWWLPWGLLTPSLKLARRSGLRLRRLWWWRLAWVLCERSLLLLLRRWRLCCCWWWWWWW